MATLYRPTRTRPLPPKAEIVTRALDQPKKLKAGGTATEWRFVRVRDGKKTAEYPLTEDGRSYLRPTKKWYAKLRLPGGRMLRKPLSANKDAARMMMADVLRGVERLRSGTANPFESHLKRPLTEHLRDFEQSLRGSGVSAKHVRQTAACARFVIEGCGFAFIPDVSASRVQELLSGRRQDSAAPALPDGQELFTRDELAAILGTTAPVIPSLISRHNLEAVGLGKARRYPRKTAAALAALRGQGWSNRTSNQHLVAVKQFSRWLVQDRRTADNPLAHLSGLDPKQDRRRKRRVLPADELRRIIVAAGSSAAAFRGLAGVDRAVLYSVACASGFRAGELAVLTPEAFDLASAPPTVHLTSTQSKNGQDVFQPLPADLSGQLQAYLVGKPAGVPVWPGTWHLRAADMLRGDLDAAGVPFVVGGREGTLVADFHALRHSFIALLDAAGSTLREAMQLARHSDPKLTMSVYGRLRLHDLGSAVDRLPSLVDCPPADHARGVLGMTGTDGPARDVPNDAPASDNRRGH